MKNGDWQLYLTATAAEDGAEMPWVSSQYVATCGVCEGKYRPAGGPCIHEHPAWSIAASAIHRDMAAEDAGRSLRGVVQQSGPVCCLVCGVSWYPGHACIRQPTAHEVQDMREQAYWLRVMEDVLDCFGYETSLATPAAWEAV